MSPGGAGESPTSAVIARSLVWPGAYAIAQGKSLTCVYIGDAIKYASTPYCIPNPPALQAEWAPQEEEGEEGALVEPGDLLIDPTPPEEPEED